MESHFIRIILFCGWSLPLSRVMLQSAKHPFIHTLRSFLYVFIAPTMASMAPHSPAFSWLSPIVYGKSFHSNYFVLWMIFTIVKSDVFECSTSVYTHINIGVVCLHPSYDGFNGFTLPCFGSVIAYCLWKVVPFKSPLFCGWFLQLPLVMLPSATDPYLHTSISFLYVFIAPTITSMAPHSPAFAWLSPIVYEKSFH